MIFDKEDQIVLRRTMVRKGCETAAVQCNPNLTEAQRAMVADELVRDIARCALMIHLGSNDLAELEDELDLFESELSAMPPGLYTRYMESMDRDEREDEGQYMWMLSALISSVPMLREGLEFSERLVRAEPVLSSDRVSDIVTVRDMAVRFLPRCASVGEGALGDCAVYLDSLARECSLLLRISSGREADSEEISEVLSLVTSVDGGDFARLFGLEMTPEESAALARFDWDCDDGLAVLCGRAVANSLLGRPSSLLLP